MFGLFKKPKLTKSEIEILVEAMAGNLDALHVYEAKRESLVYRVVHTISFKFHEEPYILTDKTEGLPSGKVELVGLRLVNPHFGTGDAYYGIGNRDLCAVREHLVNVDGTTKRLIAEQEEKEMRLRERTQGVAKSREEREKRAREALLRKLMGK